MIEKLLRISPFVKSDIRDIIVIDLEEGVEKLLRFAAHEVLVSGDINKPTLCEIKDGAKIILHRVRREDKKATGHFKDTWTPIEKLGPNLEALFAGLSSKVTDYS